MTLNDILKGLSPYAKLWAAGIAIRFPVVQEAVKREKEKEEKAIIKKILAAPGIEPRAAILFNKI
jgi:hypothetical protein